MALQEFQQRAVDEEGELIEKITKLRTFIDSSKIFTGLPNAEQFRLRLQLSAMCLYSDILAERIARFGDSNPPTVVVP